MPDRSKVNLGIRGEVSERDRLRKLATAHNTSIQELVESAIKRYLVDEETGHPGTALQLPPLTAQHQILVVLTAQILYRNNDPVLEGSLESHLFLLGRLVLENDFEKAFPAIHATVERRNFFTELCNMAESYFSIQPAPGHRKKKSVPTIATPNAPVRSGKS